MRSREISTRATVPRCFFVFKTTHLNDLASGSTVNGPGQRALRALAKPTAREFAPQKQRRVSAKLDFALCRHSESGQIAPSSRMSARLPIAHLGIHLKP